MANYEASTSICGFHDTFLSRTTLRNFKVFVLSTTVLLIFDGGRCWRIYEFLFCKWNNEYFVLSVLSNYLLALNQVEMFCNSFWILLKSFSIFWTAKSRFVSSGKILVVNKEETIQRLLTLMRKRRRPRTDPCRIQINYFAMSSFYFVQKRCTAFCLPNSFLIIV